MSKKAEGAVGLGTRRQAERLLEGQAAILERIVAGASLAETLDGIVRLTEAHSPGMLGSILLLDPDGVHVRHGAAPSLPESFIRAIDGEPIGERAGSCGTAAFRRAPVIVDDISTDPLWESYRDLALAHGLRACWSTPILDARGDVLGTFALYFRTPGRPSEAHLSLIDLATHVAALAIGREREAGALQESEGWLRAAVAAADVGLWDWDLATDRVRFSPEWKRQLGYADHEVSDDFAEWQSRVHPVDLERSFATVRAYLAEPWPDYRLECRLRHKDGSYRWILAQASLLRDARGKPERMLGSHLDITERKRAEEELHRARDYAETLIQTANAMVVGLDTAGNVTVFNEAAERITGYTRADLAGRDWFEVLVPRDRYPQVWDEFRRLTADGGVPHTFENPIRTRAGEERHILWQNSVLREGDTAMGRLSFGVDVTERKRAEAAVRDAHDRLARIVATTPGIVCSFRLRPDGSACFPFGGERIAVHFGVPEAQLAEDAAPFLAVTHPDDLNGLMESIEESARSLSPWRHEWRVRHPAHGELWVEGHSMPLREPGGSTLWYGVATDVTDRKRMEAALLASEDQFRHVFETANVGKSITRPSGEITVNQAFADLLGYTREELAGRTWQELTPPEDVDRIQRRLAPLLRGTRDAVRLDKQYLRKDGSILWADVSVAMRRRADGRPAYFVTTLVDITERRRAEEALREAHDRLEGRVRERTAELAVALERAEAADRLKSAFLATMSHELRTPLNSILGFTGLLLQGLPGPLNAEQEKQLGMVRGSARHLLTLISDILDLSKIEAGQLKVAAETFDLGETVERAAASVEPAAGEKNLTLSVRVAKEVGEVTSDPRRVEQVLLNLLSNAVKFTDQGGVAVAAEGIPDYAGPGRPGVRVQVADTGIGIRSEDLEGLFRPFHQLDAGLTRRHEGTGLGLAICRRLAGLLGGEVRAESRWGEGSTFTFILPVENGTSP